MNKRTKSQKLNLLFSAFLVFAFTACSYFVDSYTQIIASDLLRTIVPLALFVVFGLFLFYATRVGDGKPVYRFSLSVLIFMVLPSLYLLLCNFVPTLPLAESILTQGMNTVHIGCVILGYGLPYMFVSGFEMEGYSFVREEKETDDLYNENSESANGSLGSACFETDSAEDTLTDSPKEETADTDATASEE